MRNSNNLGEMLDFLKLILEENLLNRVKYSFTPFSFESFNEAKLPGKFQGQCASSFKFF